MTKEFDNLSKHNVSIRNSPITNSDVTNSTPKVIQYDFQLMIEFPFLS